VFTTQTGSSWRLAQNAFNFSKEPDTRPERRHGSRLKHRMQRIAGGEGVGDPRSRNLSLFFTKKSRVTLCGESQVVPQPSDPLNPVFQT
jgi:hypothetical protein